DLLTQAMESLLNGVLFGLLLAIIIGPVFFALIQTSLEKGFAAGAFLAIGVSVSDSTWVILSYLGVSRILQNQDYVNIAAVLGGIILLSFGLYTFFKKIPIPSNYNPPIQARAKGALILKGIMINGFNPLVLFYWVGVMTMATINYGYQNQQLLWFFVGALGTVLATDFLKSFMAHNLRKIVTQSVLNILNKVVGIALGLFGGRLIFLAINDELPVL
ncbi:MAG: LysE family transporter, partial [Bacteroidetes bacterium]|nr:LysE family transporter [Bacteroidota bacterium]